MKAAAFEYQRAATLDEAITLLSDPPPERQASVDLVTKLCSGSQSLGPMMNLRLAQVDRLVDLRRIPELQAVQLSSTSLRIGAALTHAQIEDGLLPDVTHGLLARVASRIAYRAIRNRGTLGGSLAHADPKADWVSTMCLLDAGIILQGPTGERTIRAADFFLGPFTTALASDELLIAVEVPRFRAQARWAYRKFCRKPGEFAQAIGAVWIDPSRGITRALLGAQDSMPHIIEGDDLARLLRTPDPKAFNLAMAPGLDTAGIEEAYERDVAAAMLRRAIADLDAPLSAKP
jgi:carbon-monoxide dehydrogenase medium subunit